MDSNIKGKECETMNNQSRNKWYYSNALLLLSLTLQLFVVAAPAGDIINQGYSSVAGSPQALTYLPLPVSDNEKIHYVTAFAGNETINESKSNLVIGRNTVGYKDLVLRFFKLLFSCTILGVLILCFGYVISKRKQNISILATSLGGRAPPNGLILQADFY